MSIMLLKLLRTRFELKITSLLSINMPIDAPIYTLYWVYISTVSEQTSMDPGDGGASGAPPPQRPLTYDF